MIHERYEVDIDRPIETVFEFISDSSRISSWVDGIVSVESLIETTTKVGSRIRIRVDRPKPMEIVSEMTEWQPPYRFRTRNDVHNFPGEASYELSPTAAGTHVVFTSVHRPQGMFMRMLTPVITQVLRKERPLELERLKRRIESLPR